MNVKTTHELFTQVLAYKSFDNMGSLSPNNTILNKMEV